MEVAAADFDIFFFVNDDYRVFGMELSVRVLVRLLDSLDILDDIESLDKVDVDSRCVADESEHGVVLAEAAVNRDAEAFKPVHKIVALLFVVIFSKNNYHCFSLR